MGGRCSSSQKCSKWSSRACGKITEEERGKIFQNFWDQLFWDSKKMYICSLVDQKVIDPHSMNRRQITYLYHLKVDTEKFPVCKKMFLNTFGLKEGSVRRWLQNYFKHDNTTPPINTNTDNAVDDPENDAGKCATQSRCHREKRIQHAMEFIESLPKLPSHCTRRDSSRLYLQGDIPSMSFLYRLYKSKQLGDSRATMSRQKFFDVVKRMNVGIFKPRKDMCDFCESYEKKNKTHEDHLEHISLKDRARAEKEKDKEAANRKECYTITVDLMNVQCLPYIRASSAYYKLKLVIHNYTTFNLEDRDVKNFWFDETVATLDASTYASCLVNYIEELYAKEHRPKMIVWSDGCTAQNRNSIIANALLHLSSKLRTKIVQKYLEKGHTQMEVDSVHSHIERSMKIQQIYTLTGYISVTLGSRVNSAPYRAMYLTPDFVNDFEKNLIYPSIRPGSRPGDPVVTDLRVIEYDGEKIWYMLNFDDEPQLIPRKRCMSVKLNPDRPSIFPSKRSGFIKIPYDKWVDLQALKAYVPLDCQNFYDTLQFEQNSIRKEKRAKKQQEIGHKKSKKE